MALTAGTRLGPYEIVAPLGAGGMGEVYRARDGRLGRDVAVKVLPVQTAADSAAVLRLQQEARTIASLAHPNIVSIFDVGSEAGVWFIVTELLSGGTLRDRLAHGALPGPTAVRYALEVARGLAAAHDRGVVHRDLKPENIFLTTDGLVKILDFGLARSTGPLPADASSETVAARTTPGMILGTVGYMAPEQARGLVADARADLFALGVILYEMLSGRRAFRADTTAETLAVIIRDEPPSLSGLGITLPPGLERIVRRCLEKEPARRFQSAHDLAFALETPADTTSSGSVVAPAPAPAEKGLVVLPFENMSPDPENEFLADGLTEEIIADLSKLRGVRVISRASSLQLKGRRDIARIASELGVTYVLSGSVRRAGPRLRITAQLIEGAADVQLWSDKYNGTMDDVFDMQEQVSRAIAKALELKLSPEESREIARRPIADPRAYECYLRARTEVMRFTEDGLERAMRDVRNAMAMVGPLVPLLAVEGDIHWQYYNTGLSTDPVRLDEVARLAQRIEDLEPGSPHALRLRALHAVHAAGDLVETARLLMRAIASDPTDVFSATLFVFDCGFLGRLDRAEAVAARVLEIDPLQPLTHAMLGWTLFMQGEFERALPYCGRSLELEPATQFGSMFRAQALGALGRIPEAVATLELVEAARPNDKWTWICQVVKWGLEGDAASLARSLTPDRRAWCATDPHYALLLAEAFALAGRVEEAFEWLETTIRRGTVAWDYLSRHDVFLRPLHGDARWAPLMARVRTLWEQVDI